MQISIETTNQSASLLTASTNGGGQGARSGTSAKDSAPAAVSVLEAASKRAEEDAVVIAALREAVEEGKDDAEDDKKDALASADDYRKTASQLKTALGEEAPPAATSLAYESATISTTTIEAEIGGNTVSAEFVSFERVSFNSDTGLSVRSASAASIEGSFGAGSFSYQRAAVSELYAGTGSQVSNLTALTA